MISGTGRRRWRWLWQYRWNGGRLANRRRGFSQRKRCCPILKPAIVGLPLVGIFQDDAGPADFIEKLLDPFAARWFRCQRMLANDCATPEDGRMDAAGIILATPQPKQFIMIRGPAPRRHAQQFSVDVRRCRWLGWVRRHRVRLRN